MDLDLRLVRYFVAVAEELHFGRAATKLHVSQPALSRQIRKLEDDVGGSLLVRDSRHVALTPRGRVFLDDARQLLGIAERMSRLPEDNTLRTAHIFELATSRTVADEFTATHPEVHLIERSMDSVRQLDALLAGRLDVAVLRVTRQMIKDHPVGWHHRLIRLEPLMLVGRPGEASRPLASLHERPIEVFGDAAGSGLYNAHGEYLTQFERDVGVTLRWLGNPGTFSHCLSAVRRSPSSAFILEFDSYAQRYAELGLPVHQPAELLPVYPWSVAWRDEPMSSVTADYVRTARRLALQRVWATPATLNSAPIWLPPDDPTGHH